MTGNRNRITLLTLGTVIASRILVRTGAGDPLDRAARDALARPLGPRADVTIGAVTDLGSVYGLTGIATTLWLGGRRRAAFDSAVAGGAAWIVAQSLKPTLDRPRPYQVDAAQRLVAVPAGSSWPSGHSAVAAATATSLSPHLGPASRLVAAGFVSTVAVSRLYVGVHHLTDVLAGVAVGHLCARTVRGIRRVIWGSATIADGTVGPPVTSRSGRPVEVIAFDADDTLWHSESLFAVTERRVAELLGPHVETEVLERELLATERRNLGVYGYGVKGFTLSLVETALTVSEGRITSDDIATILTWGKELLSHPVELLEGVEETVRTLAEQHRLALITKGDLFHQESKIAESGLGELFEHVAVVAEKDAAAYARFAGQLGVEPAAMVMVGNSVRSDVLPVLELGGRAVHIPYEVTWSHEVAEVPASAEDGGAYVRLRTVRELPPFLADLAG